MGVTNGAAGRAVVVGSGLAGLACALELAGSGWETTVVTAGRAGRDGATHRVHGLTPWILLTAPWVRGDSPDRFLADLGQRGQGLERAGLAEVLAENAHAAARELIEVLDLEPVTDEPVTLPGDDGGARAAVPCRATATCCCRPLLRRCAAAGRVRCASARSPPGCSSPATGSSGVTLCGRDGAGPERHPRGRGGAGVRRQRRGVSGDDGAALVPRQRPRRGRDRRRPAAPARADPGAAGHGDGPALFPDLGRARHRHDLDRRPHAAARSATSRRRRWKSPGRDATASPRFSTPTAARGRLLPPRLRGGAAPAEGAPRGAHGRPASRNRRGGDRRVGADVAGRAVRVRRGGRRGAGAPAHDGHRAARGGDLREAGGSGGGPRRRPAGRRTGTAPPRAAGPPLPVDPDALERRLDELLRPLVVERPTDAVAQTVGELEAWPVRSDRNGCPDEKVVLAAIRRQAAVLILAGSLGDAGRGA